ncbi:HNH endonuclease [Staphylococcus auricularis]|uniref:HNH endonuclease n=1 Tax=Staphylococcus auricularis TaxID=29379 RepID=UPI003EBF2ACA
MNELIKAVEQWSRDEGLHNDNSDFKLINDYPNYVISKNGDVIALSYIGASGQKRKMKVLKQITNADGYKNVILLNNEGKKSFRVHRLVAQAFIPNPKNKETVNHIDGDKTNNKVDNLE